MKHSIVQDVCVGHLTASCPLTMGSELRCRHCLFLCARRSAGVGLAPRLKMINGFRQKPCAGTHGLHKKNAAQDQTNAGSGADPRQSRSSDVLAWQQPLDVAALAHLASSAKIDNETTSPMLQITTARN